jgi:hypothetical protein
MVSPDTVCECYGRRVGGRRSEVSRFRLRSVNRLRSAVLARPSVKRCPPEARVSKHRGAKWSRRRQAAVYDVREKGCIGGGRGRRALVGTNRDRVNAGCRGFVLSVLIAGLKEAVETDIMTQLLIAAYSTLTSCYTTVGDEP